jgi:hypothetical protein
MELENSQQMFAALKNDDYIEFSKAVKQELAYKAKNHPFFSAKAAQMKSFKDIEAMYANIKGLNK